MADRRLQIFHAVAKYQSFTRAAEALFMTQPAVTFQVRQLEAYYNTRLLERRTGGVVLTPSGALVYDYAQKILALNKEMETRLGEMTDEIKGHIRIGSSSALSGSVMADLLRAFNALYPQVRLELSVAASADILRAVSTGDLALALVDGPNPALLDGGAAGLSSQLCGRGEMVVVCAPDYPLRGRKHLAPGALEGCEYLERDEASGGRAAISAYFAAQQVNPDILKPQMTLGNYPSLLSLVAQGVGVAIVPRLVLQDIGRTLSLRTMPLNPPLWREVFLVTAENELPSRLLQTLSSFIRNQLQEKEL